MSNTFWNLSPQRCATNFGAHDFNLCHGFKKHAARTASTKPYLYCKTILKTWLFVYSLASIFAKHVAHFFEFVIFACLINRAVDHIGLVNLLLKRSQKCLVKLPLIKMKHLDFVHKRTPEKGVIVSIHIDSPILCFAIYPSCLLQLFTAFCPCILYCSLAIGLGKILPMS